MPILPGIGPQKLQGPRILIEQTSPDAFAPAGVLADNTNLALPRPLVRWRLGPRGRGPMLRTEQQGFQTATVKPTGGSKIAGPGGGCIVG